MDILCETSIRHVHLTKNHVEQLFGKGATLTPMRPLSQPGQFLANQRVTLIGPKSSFKQVAIVGPSRDISQAEISRTDAFALGMKDVPLRLSGDLQNSPGITIKGDRGTIKIDKGVIIAKRHVHLDPQTAEKLGVKQNDIVDFEFDGERKSRLGEIIVRISPDFLPALHLDSDEANAVFAKSTVKW